MDKDIKQQLAEIEVVGIDPEKFAAAKSEEEFIGLGVDLLIEVGSHVCVAASILPADTKHWTRNQAIIGGNLVRLYKLISALLDQTCQHRRETMFILARLAFETVVNIRYLVERGTTEMFDSYVLYSLRHEKKLYDKITKNIEARGSELPIERRMLNSIERTAKASGISILDASSSNPKKWGGKNLFQRAQEIGLESAYLAAFGGGSHSVHGNWMDLLDYHLKNVDGGFVPQLQWRAPRPQVLFAIALLSSEVVRSYLRSICDDATFEFADGKITSLSERIRAADSLHEEFLSAGV